MIWRLLLIATMLVTGCSTNKSPAELSKSEVEAHFRKTKDWKEVSLQEGGNGKYTGTVIMTNGEQLNLEVQQNANGIEASWKSVDGNHVGNSKETWN